MNQLLQIAFAELGIKEIPGVSHHERILEYARSSGFGKQVDRDEIPWCSIFMNWCCQEARLQRSHQMNARSWLQVGLPVDDPVPGDVVIFWRESPASWKGHVGLFLGFSKNLQEVFTLGGNQDNSVSVRSYQHEQVLGFRRLGQDGVLVVPDEELKEGSRGPAVMQLQRLLNFFGFYCGYEDGIFGRRTLEQLQKLQTQTGLQVTGHYTQATQDILKEMLLE
ncbi:TIGR02594 family protein [Persicobacter diffluens]|uniref:TIGR02594 family protein n=1 Tax=Persicobacter diffluens TaxID=981 RepID=A0AAN5AM83_9BACT|nr:hypothetical protein PEDI_53470 [Persicobacter diffluens]